jgi:uncharacterized protein
MKARLMNDVKAAMKAGEKAKLGTLRLIQAEVQKAEIAGTGALDDAGVIQVMTKMVKQRRDSITQYTTGGRADLAAVEQAEIEVIEAYLPKQMDEAAVAAAIKAAIAEAGAASAKDMGKVMAVLKAKYAGQMDFQKASAAVKAALG